MSDEIPQVAVGPVKPGAEMQALRPFHRNCTWSGKVRAGAMGPGAPEMYARGHGSFEWVMGGLWVVADFEQDQFVNDESVLRWKAHYVAGWDRGAGEYRAFIADSNGVISMLIGDLSEGNFILTSMPGGRGEIQPMRLKMTRMPDTPATMKWRNEGSVNGGPWFLIEEYTCTFTD